MFWILKRLSLQCSHAIINSRFSCAREVLLKISALLRFIACTSIFLCLVTDPSSAQSIKNVVESTVLDAAKLEIDRDFAELKTQTPAPYYISYQIADSNTATITSSFGALQQSSTEHRRLARVDVRVGDYKLDNTHQEIGRAHV